jgi:hypothetical protein
MNARRGTSTSSRLATTVSTLGGPLVALGLVTALGIGLTVLILAYAGWFRTTAARPSRAGLVAVPRSIRPLKAYTRIRREDIYDLRQGDESYYWMDAERVKANPDWLVRVDDIIGRVLATDKEEGYVFSEKNFLPKGSRAGIVGGIPPGKRSMVVAVDQTPGLEQLQAGDQFDLLVSSSTTLNKISGPAVEYAALLGGIKAPELRVGQRAAADGGVRVVVQAGTLLGVKDVTPPAGNRNPRTSTTVRNATIAVAPEEVATLTEALGAGAKLFCVARSGQPRDRENTAQELADKVPVVVLARTLEAFSEITEEDLADPASGALNVYYFPQERVGDRWIREPQQLIGRVVRHDTLRGHVLSEEDLMPVGTRPGIAAGAPPGMRIYVAPTTRIQGLAGLQVGDAVAIYGTVGQQVAAAPPQLDWASLKGGQLDPEEVRLSQEVRAGIRTVVRRAVIVRAPKGDSVTFALAPDEVTPLSQALNASIPLFAVAASSQDDAAAEPTGQMPAGQTPAGSVQAGDASRPEPRTPATSDKVTSDKVIGSGQPATAQPAVAYITTDVTPAVTPAGTSDFTTDSIQPATVNQATAVLATAQPTAARPAAADRDGWLAFPITARPVRAYERLTVEDFVDPSTGRLRMFYFPPDKVSESWIGDLETLLDRVVGEEIDAGRVVQMQQLLPVGSRPGPAAGVPPGWRAVTVTSRELAGLEHVRDGDRLDLVESLVFGMDDLSRVSPEVLSARRTTTDFPRAEDLFKQAEVSVVARHARVVTIAREKREEVVQVETESAIREVVTDAGVQREGVQKVQQPQVIERTVIVCNLAVKPEDVARVMEAVAIGSRLYAVVQSASSAAAEQPGELVDASDLEPIRAAWQSVGGRVHKVEHIRGTDRRSEEWVAGHRFGTTPLGRLVPGAAETGAAETGAAETGPQQTSPVGTAPTPAPVTNLPANRSSATHSPATNLPAAIRQ